MGQNAHHDGAIGPQLSICPHMHDMPAGEINVIGPIIEINNMLIIGNMVVTLQVQ